MFLGVSLFVYAEFLRKGKSHGSRTNISSNLNLSFFIMRRNLFVQRGSAGKRASEGSISSSTRAGKEKLTKYIKIGYNLQLKDSERSHTERKKSLSEVLLI